MPSLHEASKQTVVTTPFPGFERAIVVCQIIQHTAGLSTEQIFLISPVEQGIPDLHSPLLMIGASALKHSLVPMNYHQVEMSLEMLEGVLRDKDRRNSIISLNEVEEACINCKNLSENSIPPSAAVVRLSNRIHAVVAEVAHTELWSIEMSVSGNAFIPLTFEFVGFPGSDDTTTLVYAMSDLDVAQLKGVRLLDDVIISMGTGSSMKRVYTGLCTSLQCTEGFINIRLNSHMYQMNKSTINHLSITNANALDMVHFVSKTSGLEDSRLIIDGFNRIRKVYTVTMPVQNMQVDTLIGIGSVTISSPDQSVTDLLKLKELAKDNAIFFEENVLASVNVEADSVYDAYILGKLQIEQALDILMHIIRGDCMLVGVGHQRVVQKWQRDNLTPIPKVLNWIFIEESDSGSCFVMDTTRLMQPYSLSVGEDIQSELEFASWYEDLFITLIENKDAKRLKPLFNALKWIRRTWDSDNTEDQVIFANVALEFVAEGEKVTPIFPKKYKEAVIEGALEALRREFEGPEDELNVCIDKLDEKLSDSLLVPPTMAKIRNLIDRLDIPVENAEMDAIGLSRKIRNKLVHGTGSSMEISETDMRKAINAIGLIVSHKLYSLYTGGSK